MPKPWEKYAGGAPGTIVAAPQYRVEQDAREEARKDAAEGRANEDQGLDRTRVGLSQRDSDRSDRNSARDAASDAIDNPQKLRKEYAALPEVREYKVAMQMASAALGTAANPQGDIALVYSFAKAMDPGSVVRDQEANMVTDSQPWFKSAVENVKKQFGMDGAGAFTSEARAALRQEIMRAVASRKPLYDARRQEMASIAQANNVDPGQIIGKSDTDVYADGLRSYALKNGDPGNVISGVIGGGPIEAPTPQAPKAAGYGATTSAIPIPAAMQQEQNAYLAANWGKVDPRDYTAFRINLDKKYGFGSNTDAYTADATKLNEFAARGGTPGQTGIQDIKQELTGFDQFRNNALSDSAGIGAGVTAGLNAAGLGLPSLLARGQMDALRDANPVATTIGDIGGGLVGTGTAGKLLGGVASKVGSASVASALSKPLAADLAFGGIYGATQADDPLYGAAGGVASALVGNKVGAAVGRALPSLAGQGRAIAQLDATVPQSKALKESASELYKIAEDRGLTATGDQTFALADTTSGILSKEGRLSPTGRLTEVQPKTKEAYQLVQDYAGQPMTPTQIQTVRGVMSDGLGSPEPDERRVARLLVDNFDNWTDGTNPQLASDLARARSVASRYLQGDKIAQARDLAQVRAGQFSDSGAGNAVRTDFRQLDRSIAKGQEMFTPEVEQAVAETARGTVVGNLMRNAGRFAPTGPVSALPMLAAIGGGQATAGPLGAAGGLALGALALGSRELGKRITNRSAQVAENIAYAGPQYKTDLEALLEIAAARGGHAGTAIGSEVARALTAKLGY